MQQLLSGKTRLPGFNEPWREVRLGENAVTVTPTEYRLLETLVRAAGRTFTRQELDAAGVGLCLMKPARQSQLFDAIGTLLARKFATGEEPAVIEHVYSTPWGDLEFLKERSQAFVDRNADVLARIKHNT